LNSTIPVLSNSAAEEAEATALMPFNSTILVPPNSAAEKAEAPIIEAALQEDIGEEVDQNEADSELEQVNDEDAGFDVVDSITADVHQQQCNECEVKKTGAY